MIPTIIPCPECTAPMVFDHRTNVTGKKGQNFTIKTFHCEVCDQYHDVYANGMHDQYDEYLNLKAAAKLSDDEKKARKS